MTPVLFHLAALSVKIALLGAILWIQLYFLRQASALLRSRLCFAAFGIIPLLAALQLLMPTWIHGSQPGLPLFTLAWNTILPAATAAPNSGTYLTANPWILWCWLAGVAVMTARAIAGRAALAALRSRSTAALEPSRAPLPYPLEVRTAAVHTPILAGLFSPVVLVPADYSSWTPAQREMVLHHEHNHFRQADHWALLLAQTVRAILWFHPVVWLLAARLSQEQELACDEAVLAAGHSPHNYAAFLLDSIRGLHSTDLLSCSMAGSGSASVKQRFARLLHPEPLRVHRGWLAASLAAIGAFAAVVTVVTPVWSQSENAQTGKQTPSQIYSVGGDVLPPRLLTKVEPVYTEEAKTAKIEGPVMLSVVVTPEGKPDKIEVVTSLDPGLDINAMNAVAKWTFEPAMRDGKPVAVRARIEINYRLL